MEHNNNFVLKIHIVIEMALKGIRVLELAGLAPAPFCGKKRKYFHIRFKIHRIHLNVIYMLNRYDFV